MIPSQEVFRSAQVIAHGCCPACGDDLSAYGVYPFIASRDQMWKTICPHCKKVFPSNDFASYYLATRDGYFTRAIGYLLRLSLADISGYHSPGISMPPPPKRWKKKSMTSSPGMGNWFWAMPCFRDTDTLICGQIL
ncbi:MAG TPA: hypothetical protein DCY75_03410, partial [Clostridiales bacterium]|nr:hypothetical protein [Clostridiales bacterium]